MSIPAPRPETLERIKKVLRTNLKLGQDKPIPDNMALIGGELDLDSLDVLMLVTAVEKEFGFKIASEAVGRDAFTNVTSLARFVDERVAGSPGSPGTSGAKPGGGATG